MACDDPTYAALHPTECVLQAAGNAVGQVAQSGFDRLLAELAAAMVRTSNLVMTFWMKVPSANPLTTPYTTGGRPTAVPTTPELTDAISTARGSLLALVAVVGFVGIVVAAARAVRHNRAGEMIPIPEMLFRLIAVSMFGVVAVWVGIQTTDLYANWILERAQPGFGATPSPGFIKEEWIISAGLVTGGLQVLVGVLASLAQIMFMFFRGALLLLLLVVWPTVAAGTATEAGLSAWKKLNAWIIALLLYKPIAATVYAVGFLVYAKTDVAQGFGGEVMSLLLGTTILVLAAVALPMLVRFVMPPAGIGASSAFSGGAVLAGVATGAVAVAGIAATGGASAAASGSGAATMGTGAGLSAGGAGGGSGPQSNASGNDQPPKGGGSDSGASDGPGSGNGAKASSPADSSAPSGSNGANNPSAGSTNASSSSGASAPAQGGAGASGSGSARGTDQDTATTPAANSSGASGSGPSRPAGGGAAAAAPPQGAAGSAASRNWRSTADAIPSGRDQNDVWEGQ